MALGGVNQVTGRSGDLLGKDVRANQRQTGALAGKRRRTVGGVAGKHDSPIRPSPHAHLRHFASVEVIRPVEFRYQRSEAPPDIAERGLQRALLSDGILQWRLRSPIGEVKRHAKLIVGPIGIDNDATLGRAENELPGIEANAIGRRVDPSVNSGTVDILLVPAECEATDAGMETVGADEQVEVSLSPAPQFYTDAIALLTDGHDLVPKNMGHQVRTGGEEDPREIISEKLYVVAVKAATAQGCARSFARARGHARHRR